MTVSDATFVNGVIAGDRAAFTALYDRKARFIRAVCYDVTHDFASAADLTQEVFLRAYRGLAELRDPERFGSWLLGIAKQVCREWRRRQRRQPQSSEGFQHETVAVDDRMDADCLDDLRRAITDLPNKERLALHAFYLMEMDAEQARRMLELSRSGFYRVLSRARRRLRRGLLKHAVHS